MTSRLQIPWPRLVAEFLVIVTGVLVALGVDQWVQERRDRALEQEYLERLLADVRYDLDEFAFIRDRSRISLEAQRLVVDPSWVTRAPGDSLLSVAIVASLTRSPDLARSTFVELINSGRIELIRSRDVREALATYDRAVGELVSFYPLWHADAQEWLFSRLPPDEVDEHQQACRTAESLVTALVRVCPHEFGIDPEPVRADLLSDDGSQRFMLLGHRHLSGGIIAELLIEHARVLERVLEAALGDGPDALP